MYQLLIADDEMIERKVLHKALQKHLGDICEIHQAENGREALAIYKEKHIQIAVLDIEMPGIDGIQAAEKIRAQDSACCIIFLTAFDEFSYAKKAITVRALDYLLKPYREEELLMVLDEAIRLTKMRKRDGESATGQGKPPLPPLPAEPAAIPEEPVDTGQIRLTKVTEIIEEYIQSHYMQDISMQDVARVMNYSEAYFCKLFKQCFSFNFTTYLAQIRMDAAKKLLARPTVNVKDIGKAVGYSDSNYFAKVFKRYTGFTPTEYRVEIFQSDSK